MVNQGDILFLDFDPVAGHEQKGRRPAIVISNHIFNQFSNLAMVCPITSTDKNHPLHIRLEDSLKTKGVILCDQARILDIAARNGTFIERASSKLITILSDVVAGFVEVIK
jgi:mRNA interferase MazF